VIEVDGAQGEGGGQILRTTLSLSVCMGLAMRINNIRAARARPGLLRQHLTCLKAMRKISQAEVSGDVLGSSEVVFSPGDITPGEYHFAIGSAGSTTLVFQTILMPLLLANGVSEVVFEGGTHNGMAPSFDFIDHCFLPAIASIGCRVETKFEKYGFYPSGGGCWRARIYPMKEVTALKLCERGQIVSQYATAISANIPSYVNERELAHVKKRCQWPDTSLHREHVKSVGAGNILSLRITSEASTEMFESVGEKGVSSERVAARAVRNMNRYVKANVPVGEYLADQLILPTMLGGGVFRTLQPSQHLLTNREVVQQLTDINIDLTEVGKDCWEVTIPRLEKLVW
jgi:RNA 3'-terminal phosphate cyclase (ATP)